MRTPIFFDSQRDVFDTINQCAITCSAHCLDFVERLQNKLNQFNCSGEGGEEDRSEIISACTKVFNNSYNRDSIIKTCTSTASSAELVNACASAYQNSYDRDNMILSCVSMPITAKILTACVGAFNNSYDRNNKVKTYASTARSASTIQSCVSSYNNSYDRDNKILECIK